MKSERRMMNHHQTHARSAPSIHHSSFAIHHSAFTLTEILIVIALIVLVIALAVPAFSFITGSRSVDAGENLVSAMLSRARAEAMSRNAVCGVAVFLDLRTDRS